MRYLMLKASTPTDTRYRTFDSVEEFHAAWGGVVSEHESELEAVTAVRWMYPDAVGMPAPVPIGSGKVVVMALLERSQPIDTGGVIPFVAVVQAVPENGLEKHAIKKMRHFDKKLWMVPVVKPRDGQVFKCELRSNQIEVPLRPDVVIGHDRGRLVMHVTVGDIQNSYIFDDPNVHFGTLKPDAITSEGASKVSLEDVHPDGPNAA